MLLSEHIRLIAAFDHRHVFLDPNPDAAAVTIDHRHVEGVASRLDVRSGGVVVDVVVELIRPGIRSANQGNRQIAIAAGIRSRNDGQRVRGIRVTDRETPAHERQRVASMATVGQPGLVHHLPVTDDRQARRRILGQRDVEEGAREIAIAIAQGELHFERRRIGITHRRGQRVTTVVLDQQGTARGAKIDRELGVRTAEGVGLPDPRTCAIHVVKHGDQLRCAIPIRTRGAVDQQVAGHRREDAGQQGIDGRGQRGQIRTRDDDHMVLLADRCSDIGVRVGNRIEVVDVCRIDATADPDREDVRDVVRRITDKGLPFGDGNIRTGAIGGDTGIAP